MPPCLKGLFTPHDALPLWRRSLVSLLHKLRQAPKFRDFSKSSFVRVQVDRCGGEVTVTQERLDAPHVSPGAKKAGGAVVPQAVGFDVVVVSQPRDSLDVRDHSGQPFRADAPPLIKGEEVGVVGFGSNRQPVS